MFNRSTVLVLLTVLAASFTLLIGKIWLLNTHTPSWVHTHAVRLLPTPDAVLYLDDLCSSEGTQLISNTLKGH
ncbi:hypothetical protein P303_02610 [Xylella fastidiosa MUL0034]|nr:hypothetical protein P303_02610 [Xylella fastidiosa MUL0034]